jgi:hypothetical protein
MANEPRSYRETIAEAFRALRPGMEVITVEPADLDDSVRRLAPDVVICSEATDTVRENVPIWVELYPRHQARSVVSVGGRCEEYAEIELTDLLAILDRAEGLTR